MKHITTLLFLGICTFLFSQNQNISNGNVFDGEPYLAINPNDSQHMVIAWMGWINVTERFKIKTKSSFDGGLTWSAVSELPHTVVGYSSADPSIAFHPNGNVFISYIDFTGTTPPVTGGVYISKSTDGGISWSAPTEVINTNFDGSKWPIDRPWLVIDQSNGSSQGTLYVTTMNLNRTNPSFNPYLSISHDEGATFSTTYVDAADWLAGSINPLPMCSPTVSSSGVFYGAYPSYTLSQSLYAQAFLAASNDGGNTLSHSTLITHTNPTNIGDFEYAKKASLLLSNPANALHLAYIFLSAYNGDLDVYLIETFDSGNSWSTPLRLNDDSLGNGSMQDLIWGDFDTDGGLIVSWRDRRNGTANTFQSSSEIWATYRSSGASSFAPNFPITSQTVDYDSVLESAGNDFMCIKLNNGVLHATWGDTRTSHLNIWFQTMHTDGTILSTQHISSEPLPRISVYPNPSNDVIQLKGLVQNTTINIYNILGAEVLQTYYQTNTTIDISKLDNGMYFIQVKNYPAIRFIKR